MGFEAEDSKGKRIKMGMICNRIEVMLRTQNDKIAYWEMALDDEIVTVLVDNDDLFDSVTTMGAFLDSIGKAFKEPWMVDEDLNYIESYCNDYEDYEYKEGELEDIIRENSSKSFSKNDYRRIVLVSNNEVDGGREYEWKMFDFEEESVKKGRKRAKYGDNFSYDRFDCKPKSEDFMESLIMK